MPKRADSPVPRFPGYVVLPDFLILQQVFDFETTNDKIAELKGDKIRRSQLAEIYLPYLFGVVLEWHIDGQPEKPNLQTWRATPIQASSQLIAWIFGEITKIYFEEVSIPNA